jgi:hypothetical protein
MIGGIGARDDNHVVAASLLFRAAVIVVGGENGLDFGRCRDTIFELLFLVAGELSFLVGYLGLLWLRHLDDSRAGVRGRHDVMAVDLLKVLGGTQGGTRDGRNPWLWIATLWPGIYELCIAATSAAAEPPQFAWAVVQFDLELVLPPNFDRHSRMLIATGSGLAIRNDLPNGACALYGWAPEGGKCRAPETVCRQNQPACCNRVAIWSMWFVAKGCVCIPSLSSLPDTGDVLAPILRA